LTLPGTIAGPSPRLPGVDATEDHSAFNASTGNDTR
jgi:hypothetical protein